MAVMGMAGAAGWLLAGCASAPPPSPQSKLETLQQRLDKEQAKGRQSSEVVAQLEKAIDAERDLGVLQSYADKHPGASHSGRAARRVTTLIDQQQQPAKLLSWHVKHHREQVVRQKVEQRLDEIVTASTNVGDLLSIAAHHEKSKRLLEEVARRDTNLASVVKDSQARPFTQRAAEKAKGLLREQFEVISDEDYARNISEKDGTPFLKAVLTAREKGGHKPGQSFQEIKRTGEITTFTSTGHMAEDAVEHIWYRTPQIHYDFYAYGSPNVTRQVIGKSFEEGKRNVMTEIYTIDGIHYRRSWIGAKSED